MRLTSVAAAFVLAALPAAAQPLFTYDSALGFSGPPQGQGQWTYLDSAGQMPDFGGNMWTSGQGHDWCYISAYQQHPGNLRDSIRRWTAPYLGTVNVSGSSRMTMGGTASDGVNIVVLKNGVQLLIRFVLPGDTTMGVSWNETVSVVPGDTIDVVVNRGTFNIPSAHYFYDEQVLSQQITYMTDVIFDLQGSATPGSATVTWNTFLKCTPTIFRPCNFPTSQPADAFLVLDLGSGAQQMIQNYDPGRLVPPNPNLSAVFSGLLPNSTHVFLVVGMRNGAQHGPAEIVVVTTPRLTPPPLSPTVTYAQVVQPPNPVTGADFTKTFVMVKVPIPPAPGDRTPTLQKVRVLRDGTHWTWVTIFPGGEWGIDTATAMECPEAMPIGTFCVAEEVSSQHAHAPLYEVEETFDPVLSTLSAPRIAAAPRVTMPFAWGWMDTHTHLFAERAMGGDPMGYVQQHEVMTAPMGSTHYRQRPGFLHGMVAGTEAQALTSCGATHGNTFTLNGNTVDSSASPATPYTWPIAETCASTAAGSPCRTSSDFIQNMMGGVPEHSVAGFPAYAEWPRWNMYTHQMMWNGWLKRAHDFGLRMITMLALNNETVCRKVLGWHEPLCTDQTNAVNQLQEARLFEQANSSWFKIVTTPAEARQAMSEGKLAVVLGIELEEVLGRHCNASASSTTACAVQTPEQIDAAIEAWYSLGVRQVFPVHMLDNDLGGTSLHDELIMGAGFDINGRWPGSNNTYPPTGVVDTTTYLLFMAGYGSLAAPAAFLGIGTPPSWEAANAIATTEALGLWPNIGHNNCGLSPLVPSDPDSKTRSWRPQPSDTSGMGSVATFSGFTKWRMVNFMRSGLLGALTADQPSYYGSFDGIVTMNMPPHAVCNARGLTAKGILTIHALMRRGMLIDVDHSSAATRKDIYAEVNPAGYPVMAGHTQMHETVKGNVLADSEYSLDDYDLKRIMRNRGLVSPGLGGGPETLLPPTSEMLPPSAPCVTSTSRAFAINQRTLFDFRATVHNAGTDGDPLFPGGIPFGSDMNGMMKMPGPRINATGGNCGGTAAYAYGARGLQRPIPGPARQVVPWTSSGGTTFDYNWRGLATVGQLPEFIDDLANAGTGSGSTRYADEPNQIYRGAEAYIRMWEQAETVSLNLVSDSSWRASTTASASTFFRLDLDDSAFSPAVELGSRGFPPWAQSQTDVIGAMLNAAPGSRVNPNARWIAASSACVSSCPQGSTFFRKTFDVKGLWPAGRKSIRVLADDVANIFVDGLPLAGGTVVGFNPGVAFTMPTLTEGRHVIAIEVINGGGPSGIYVDLR